MGNTAAASAVIAKCVLADCMSACLCPCSDAVSDLCGRCRYPKISAIIQTFRDSPGMVKWLAMRGPQKF
jgi:hypothetical protein